MAKINPKTILHSIVVFVALLLILANTTLVRSVDVFGSPFFFAIGLLVELLLLLVLVYSFIRALRTPLHILGSILLSAWGGIQTNPYIKRIRKTKSPIYGWAIARVNPKKPFGLFLTIGAVVALYFFVDF